MTWLECKKAGKILAKKVAVSGDDFRPERNQIAEARKKFKPHFAERGAMIILKSVGSPFEYVMQSMDWNLTAHREI